MENSNVMEVIPALDLLGGRCVRLYQGDFNQVTVYDQDTLIPGTGATFHTFDPPSLWNGTIPLPPPAIYVAANLLPIAPPRLRWDSDRT